MSLGTFFSPTQAQPDPDDHPAPPLDLEKPLLHELELYAAMAVELADSNMSNILAWWGNNELKTSCPPCLRSMARRYLGVPSTSALVKRLFSVAGRAFTELRHGLIGDTLEDLM